ncbi:MAG TPA: hypothetical protein VME47_10480, partial [Acetobacteraceae bacterium]|nr:hypothetical protein [Acetobacteraceae bacterium]
GLDRLQTGQERLQTGFERLQAEQERLQTGVERLRTEQERIRADQGRIRTEIMARIDRLQDQLTQQIETGTISVSLAATTSRDAKAARESVAASNETLGLLAQQVQRLNQRVAALENKATEG